MKLDGDIGLELCQEGWMRIKRGWSQGHSRLGNDGDA